MDQKFNEGIEANFFNKPAMTNTIAIQLAQKYNCPLILARCERMEGCSFEISMHEPIQVFDANGNKRAIKEVVAEIHGILEDWITEKPSQWLWLHRRWKL